MKLCDHATYIFYHYKTNEESLEYFYHLHLYLDLFKPLNQIQNKVSTDVLNLYEPLRVALIVYHAI
jgi:hypothetical protein